MNITIYVNDKQFIKQSHEILLFSEFAALWVKIYS